MKQRTVMVAVCVAMLTSVNLAYAIAFVSGASFDEDETVIREERENQGTAPSPSAVDHAAAPPRAQTMVPDCGGNAPGVRDVVCPAAIQACDATPDPNDIRVRIFQGPPGVTKPATNQWQFLLARCANRNQLGPGGAFPGISQAELRRLPIQPQTAIIQPPGGKTLINIPTNVYLNPTPEILNTTVIGIPVQVRVTPSSYTWTFGDGGTLTTSDPGGAHPNKTTTHTYTRTGEYSIQLITTYTGEYSLDGGNTWAGITGTAHVTSPAEAITAMHIHTELITGNQ